MPILLVVTPIEHIAGVAEKLTSAFETTVTPDPTLEDLTGQLEQADAIYTNPNKSRLPIDSALFDRAPRLKIVATASTGLLHIDVVEARRRGIDVVSLTSEYATIERISSTAEHALALTLAALRHIPDAAADVMAGNWDYERFIGRQMDMLTVGVVGYGRLGKKYARYTDAIGARVLVCDPAYTGESCIFPMADLPTLMAESDIVSLHVHATPENFGLVDHALLERAKPSLLLVNTSRGEVVDEASVVRFLRAHPAAMLATDVLTDELTHKWDSPLLALARSGGQVLVTPHIGGMTTEAQEIAYHRTADMLIERFAERSAIKSPTGADARGAD